MAKTLGGYPDATAATCTGADRYGLDLKVTRHAGWPTPASGTPHRSTPYDDLRSATVELARRG